MAAENRKREASFEDFASLTDHVEKMDFHEYQLLNDDCKRGLIGNLGLRTMVRLGMCAKYEQQIVAGTPFKIEKIKLMIQNQQAGTKVTLGQAVEVTDYEDYDFTVRFEQAGGSVVMRSEEGRCLRIPRKGKYYKSAIEFFEFLLKKSNYGVESISLQMGKDALDWAAREDSPIRFPHVRNVELGNMNTRQQKYWLQKMPPNLEMLEFQNSVSSEIVEMPHFRNARNIDCEGGCAVTDKLLLELNAVDICIEMAYITEEGINAFIKRWQRGEGVDGFDVLEIHCMPRGVAVDEVLEGLGVLKAGKGEGCQKWYMIGNNVRPDEQLRITVDYEEIRVCAFPSRSSSP